jgi:hypothetical protein
LMVANLRHLNADTYATVIINPAESIWTIG